MSAHPPPQYASAIDSKQPQHQPYYGPAQPRQYPPHPQQYPPPPGYNSNFVTVTLRIYMQADYVTAVEDEPTKSVKYCLPFPVFHFWPKLTHPAARSLCDSWATWAVWKGNRSCLKRLFVCLSVIRVDCDKTKENCAHFPHMIDNSSWCSDEKNGRWGQHFLHEILGQTDPNADFQPIFARSVSAVTPGEKVNWYY